MSDDFSLLDGHKIEVKRSPLLVLEVDGEYWGEFPTLEAAMVFYECSLKPQLDKRDEDEIYGAGGDPCNWWKQ